MIHSAYSIPKGLAIRSHCEVAPTADILPSYRLCDCHLLDTTSVSLLTPAGPGLDALGFDVAAGGDEVFRALVLARIIEPTSKLDSLPVLAEVGIEPPSYRTVTRHLPAYAQGSWRRRLAAACAAHAALGRCRWCSDVSTLYVETDTGDGFWEPGFSKEHRLDPQITIGLLTDAAGFPLMVNAFEGNKAETKTTKSPTRPRCESSIEGT